MLLLSAWRFDGLCTLGIGRLTTRIRRNAVSVTAEPLRPASTHDGPYTAEDLDRIPDLPPHTELIDGGRPRRAGPWGRWCPRPRPGPWRSCSPRWPAPWW